MFFFVCNLAPFGISCVPLVPADGFHSYQRALLALSSGMSSNDLTSEACKNAATSTSILQLISLFNRKSEFIKLKRNVAHTCKQKNPYANKHKI